MPFTLAQYDLEFQNATSLTSLVGGGATKIVLAQLFLAKQKCHGTHGIHGTNGIFTY